MFFVTSANASFSKELMLFSLRSNRRMPRTFLKVCDVIESIELRANFKSSNSTPKSRKSSALNLVVVNFPSDKDRMFFNLHITYKPILANCHSRVVINQFFYSLVEIL